MSRLLGSLNETVRLKYALMLEQNVEREKGDSFWDLTDVLSREQELKQEVLKSKLRRQTFAMKEESRRLDNLMIVGRTPELEENSVVVSSEANQAPNGHPKNGIRRHASTVRVSKSAVCRQEPPDDPAVVMYTSLHKFYAWLRRFVVVPVRTNLAKLRTSFLANLNKRNPVRRAPTVVIRELPMT